MPVAMTSNWDSCSTTVREGSPSVTAFSPLHCLACGGDAVSMSTKGRNLDQFPVAEIPGDTLLLLVSRIFKFLRQLRTALWLALDHDVLNTAKAAAYSGMLMLFPALVVLTTFLAKAAAGTAAGAHCAGSAVAGHAGAGLRAPV